MIYSIEHSMWPYQAPFRVGQECAAEQLFQSLDPRFAPITFLVGVLNDDRSGRHMTCVEAEDGFWIASEAFCGLSDRVQAMYATYPESRILISHPVAERRHRDSLTRRAVRDLILQVIEECPSRPRDYGFFASLPVAVDGYLVSIVLGLQSDVLASHGRLLIGEVPIHEGANMPVPRSFLDAVIQRFLASSENELQRPEAGAMFTTSNADEIVRGAAAHLMKGVVWRIDQNRTGGLHSFYGACNKLASLMYERRTGAGCIVLAAEEHPSVSSRVAFQSPVLLSTPRAARKMMELSAGELCLHCDSEQLFGLAAVQSYDPVLENLFRVNFLGHHHWELAHAGRPMMRVEHGLPYLPKPTVDLARLRSDLRRVFRGITPEQTNALIALVRQAEGEPHGTMLVLSEAAEQEATRLKNQGTAIQPRLLTPELLKHLTTIDGAVLLSPACVCYAFGVILDGMATDGGDPGRGARFNSALRYVSGSQAACMTLVFSEDQGMDILPNLRPAIRRSVIDDAIAKLQDMVQAKSVTRRACHDIVGLLHEHRFYLMRDDCSKVNDLVAKLEDRLIACDGSGFTMVYPAFEPHRDMDAMLHYETA